MKTIFAAVCSILAGLCVSHAGLVYSDNFNRTDLNGGTYTYSTTVTAGDGGASISGDRLELTNDKTAAGNASGWVYVTTPVSAFGTPYGTKLNTIPGEVAWTFNMRQIRTDPSGLTTLGNYGVAFVLAASSATLTSASGYAVVLGNSGSTDPIRLVRFSGGINGTLIDIVSATSPLNDVGANYLSLQAKYNPSDNTWSLYGRDDGSSSFADPTSGTLSFIGSAVNSTYTGTDLTHLGVVWSYSTSASQTAFFDNFSITAVPEPVNVALAIFGGIGAGVWGVRRFVNRRKPAQSAA